MDWHLPILVSMIFYHFTCFDLFVSSRTHPSAPATCLMPWWTRSTWTGAWCWPSCCTASPRRWARRWPRCLNVRYLTPDNSCMCAGPWVMFNKHHHQHWTRWNRADAAPERFIRRSYLDSFCEAQARVRQGSARDGSQGERPQSLNPCLELTLKLVATTTTTHPPGSLNTLA